MRALVAFVEAHRARGAWFQALTTTQGPGVDGLLVQRKVGSGGSRRRLREDPFPALTALSPYDLPTLGMTRGATPDPLRGLSGEKLPALQRILSSCSTE
jgi:hypothetical protein